MNRLFTKDMQERLVKTAILIEYKYQENRTSEKNIEYKYDDTSKG